MTIVIPAFRPGAQLADFIASVKEAADFRVILVDDGSGPAFGARLESLEGMGCTVLCQPKHAGRGCALKTAFRFLLEHSAEEEGVITVAERCAPPAAELTRIAEALAGSGQNLILGIRDPAGPAWWNKLGKSLFSDASSAPGAIFLNVKSDIRGYPRALLPLLLKTDGNGAEYELNVLLAAKRLGYGCRQIRVECGARSGNGFYRSGTMRFLLLSGLYLFKFCFSGLLSAVVDYSLLFLLQQRTRSLFLAVAGARAASSVLNYVLNRVFVFESRSAKQQKAFEILRYYALVAVLLCFNYLLLRILFQTLKINLVLSKIMAEAVLFLFSFAVQRLFIFQKRETEKPKSI